MTADDMSIGIHTVAVSVANSPLMRKEAPP
jgi:hypothetical protein